MGSEKKTQKISRRRFVALTAAAAPALLVGWRSPQSRTFTILHTNDIHSNLIGVGPVLEYSPSKLNNDQTLGGMERIATLIQKRKEIRNAQGPVLTLDIGDFTIGTAFGGATEKLGAELQCLSLAGFDAVTLGNHEFDNGPQGLANSIAAAKASGNLPSIIASNTNIDSNDTEVADLKAFVEEGTIKRYKIIERSGIRFGLFGIMGPDSIQYTINPGAVTFPNPIETAKEMVRKLKGEGVDVIICLSHGGLVESEDGTISEGDDIDLAKAVPEIDLILGGHTHTFMQEPLIVNGIPIVQAGCYGRAVGEIVVRINGSKVEINSYQLHRVDDSIPGNTKLKNAISAFMTATSEVVFSPRNLKSDELIAIIDQDWPNTFTDLEASRPIGNLATDAIRSETGADIAINAAGMIREGLIKGSAGAQTAYDVFMLAPLGIGVNDHSAGGTLVKAWLTGKEIKNCLEFLLVGNPKLPGQYFPRVSGFRFKYNPSKSLFNRVEAIEIGDWKNGYEQIDISDEADQLYSVGCNLYFGLILKSIPNYTKGKLSLVPKTKDGSVLNSRVEALPERESGAFLLPPKGTIDSREAVVDHSSKNDLEIKEWEAIMNYIKGLESKNEDGITLLRMDERFTENRSINIGA